MMQILLYGNREVIIRCQYESRYETQDNACSSELSRIPKTWDILRSTS